MMKNKKKNLLSAVTLTLLAATTIAGCASGEGGGATSSPSASGTSSAAGGDIPVGVLHSLTGTMSISEVSVKDSTMMAIDEINAAGGLLGRKLKPIVEDGASDPQVFAEKIKKLIQKDQVAVTFGGWTSASRKAMLPVVEQNKGLLFYPVQYEGLETSPNIVYTGATTNQQIIPAVTWLLENKGKKMFLLGSDYVFPRTANKIIKAQLQAEGGETVAEEYTPLGHTDYSTVISKIKSAKPDVIFNTLNGDSNVAFFKQLKDAGITASDIPVLSVSVAEEEIRGIGADLLAGHFASWNYYQTTDTPENKTFVEAYKAKYGKDRVTADPIEAGYFGVYLWAEAVKKAGSFELDQVKAALKNVTIKAPEGEIKFDAETQHVYKKVLIGEVKPDGMFATVWSTPEAVKPDPWLTTYPWGAGVSGKK